MSSGDSPFNESPFSIVSSSSYSPSTWTYSLTSLSFCSPLWLAQSPQSTNTQYTYIIQNSLPMRSIHIRDAHLLIIHKLSGTILQRRGCICIRIRILLHCPRHYIAIMAAVRNRVARDIVCACCPSPIVVFLPPFLRKRENQILQMLNPVLDVRWVRGYAMV